jgi:ribosomal protein S28E/S33
MITELPEKIVGIIPVMDGRIQGKALGIMTGKNVKLTTDKILETIREIPGRIIDKIPEMIGRPGMTIEGKQVSARIIEIPERLIHNVRQNVKKNDGLVVREKHKHEEMMLLSVTKTTVEDLGANLQN